MAEPRYYIVVEGIIGAGKSTFVRHLRDYLRADACPHAEAIFEPAEENPFLVPFYADMPRWAYTMQNHLLHVRFGYHMRAAVSPHTTLLDRSLWGDVCFARLNHRAGNMSDDEMASYDRARENMLPFMPYPDIAIFLDISPEEAIARIQRRSRSGETVPLAYLRGLQAEYEGMLDLLATHTPVHRVAWTDFPDDKVSDRVADAWNSAKRRIRRSWMNRQGWGASREEEGS